MKLSNSDWEQRVVIVWWIVALMGSIMVEAMRLKPGRTPTPDIWIHSEMIDADCPEN
jgi:hypothetical protein